MSNIFLCSDWHISHANILTFTKSDGSPLRNFANADEMDEYMIEKHNSVVRPQDKVYHLGDVAFNKKHMHKIARMNGNKVLIKGNHDILRLEDYTPYFRDIRGCHQMAGIFFSHVPIHPNSLSRWKLNVHGHLHSNVVTVGETKVPDPRYFCVSMERLIDYTPWSLEQIREINKKVLDV